MLRLSDNCFAVVVRTYWEEWEQAPLYMLAYRKSLGKIDFQELKTPYLKAKQYNFPAVDMIRLPNEMIQITLGSIHPPLKASHILQHLKVGR